MYLFLTVYEHIRNNFSHLYTCHLQVIALDVDLPVKQSFHILHDQVILPF